MNTLQKMFDKEIEKAWSFPAVGVKLIKRQLGRKGVTLSDKQVEQLEAKLQTVDQDATTFDFEFDDEQSKILGIADGENIQINLDGPDELDQIFDEFVERIQDVMPEIIDEMTAAILDELRKTAPAMLKAHRKDMRGFERRLANDWKIAFEKFETFLVAALEAGDEFNHDFRNDPAERNNFVLDVLTRLHARACQIASEVLVLLQNGFADGAHARWRSLHEIAVVASFIKTHGNEVAEKYLLHDKVESFKAATLYRKYAETLGEGPMSLDEYEALRAVRDQLIARFGNSYKNNYGWAAATVCKDDPNFSDIEEKAGLDHLRPYYKLASHNVHANPKGILFRMGLLKNVPKVLLAGPSNVGFTDPAQGTAYSLGLVTVTLLTAKPTIDNLVVSNVLLKLQSEIGEEFFKVQKEIERRTAEEAE